jgi:Na+(H+)/acetate symporter ActP
VNISPTAAVIFLLLVAVTLGITYWAGKRNKSVSSHLVASGHISGRQNGVAIAGDFISAATFLGTTGAIALGGFNGFYYAVYIRSPMCWPCSWWPSRCVTWASSPLGDVLATRFGGLNVRGAIATSSIILSLIYIVAQFVGAALLIKLLFGIEYWVAALIIGVLTTIYTLFGGMLATTYIQIVKTAILLFCGIVLVIMVLNKFGFNPITLFQKAEAATNAANAAAKAAGKAAAPEALEPFRGGALKQWDQFSLILGVTLGVLGLPHVMIRFLTVRDSNAARTSAVTAIWIFAGFLIFMPVLGYGGMLLIDKGRAGIPPRWQHDRPDAVQRARWRPAAVVRLGRRLRDDPRGAVRTGHRDQWRRGARHLRQAHEEGSRRPQQAALRRARRHPGCGRRLAAHRPARREAERRLPRDPRHHDLRQRQPPGAARHDLLAQGHREGHLLGHDRRSARRRPS